MLLWRRVELLYNATQTPTHLEFGALRGATITEPGLAAQ